MMLCCMNKTEYSFVVIVPGYGTSLVTIVKNWNNYNVLVTQRLLSFHKQDSFLFSNLVFPRHH